MQRIKTWMRATFITGIALSLLACSAPGVKHYADNEPKFIPEAFFSGNLKAYGVLKSRSGEVTRWFTADIQASWDDSGIGTLNEQFVFNDGEQQQRIWTLTPGAKDGQVQQYTGEAGDVIGPANIKVSGNAMFLKYRLRVPYKDDTIDVTIDDRMYLVDETTLINESVMTKFGFKVGTLLISISKVE